MLTKIYQDLAKKLKQSGDCGVIQDKDVSVMAPG